jgi:hypothetical protein
VVDAREQGQATMLDRLDERGDRFGVGEPAALDDHATILPSASPTATSAPVALALRSLERSI